MPTLDPALITLLILGIMIGLSVSGWLRADLMVLLSVVALGLSGVLTLQELCFLASTAFISYTSR